MFPFPPTHLTSQHEVAQATGRTSSHDDDAVLDAWLASLSVGELERFLDHLMDDPISAGTILESTA